jgi:nicotinamidase-related amidase
MSDISIDKNHTALLIADYSTEAISTLPHAIDRKCLAKTLSLQEAARRVRMLVCYTATVFRENYVEVSERNKMNSQRKRSGQAAVSDPLAVIHPAIKPATGEPVIGKHRVNVFYGTDLALIFNANNVDTLILLGHSTSGVVLSTTRYAADADYRIFIVEDCCMDREPAVHDFLCQKIFPRQADVVQCADVIRALTGRVA